MKDEDEEIGERGRKFRLKQLYNAIGNIIQVKTFEGDSVSGTLLQVVDDVLFIRTNGEFIYIDNGIISIAMVVKAKPTKPKTKKPVRKPKKVKGTF